MRSPIALRHRGVRAATAAALAVCLTAAIVASALVWPSAAAAVTKPVVTIQPADQTASPGSKVSFVAHASGDPKPSRLWLRSTDGETWLPVAGAHGHTLTVKATAAVNGYSYKALFTSSGGHVYSRGALLTVRQPAAKPVISVQPAALKVATGATVAFSAAASGSPAPAVQWQESRNGSTWTPIAGAIGPTLSLVAAKAQSGTKFRALFTNVNGKATSKVAALVVVNPTKAPLVTRHPLSLTAAAGQWATFTAAASGDPKPRVQWQVSRRGGGWAAIAGATATTYRVHASADLNGNRYRALFTNGSGRAASGPAVLKVGAGSVKPRVLLQPTAEIVALDGKAQFTAAARALPAAAVQWQQSSGSGSWSDVPGATKPALSVKATKARNGYSFRAVFRNSAGTATTRAAKLKVVSTVKPVVTLNPSAQTVVVNGQAVLAAAATGKPAPKIIWQESSDGKKWTTVTGATGNFYFFAATMADFGVSYRAVFTNSAGSTPTKAVRLTVLKAATKPVINVQPANEVLSAGKLLTFNSFAAGVPWPSVQWQYSAGGAAWTDIPGATGWTYQAVATSTMNGWNLRAVFSNSTGSTISNPATLTVWSAPTVTVQPTSQSAKVPATVTFTSTAGGTPKPAQRWQQSSNGTTWTDIPGAVGEKLTVTAFGEQKFRAVFTNAAGEATSATATFSVIK